MGIFDEHSDPPPKDTSRSQDSERREFARVELELVVAMRFSTMGDVVRCRTLDVSQSGVFIATQRLRDEGTRVRLSLEIGGSVLELDGVVVRVRSGDSGEVPGMGLMFTGPTAGQTMLLQALLAENVALYEGAKVRRPR